MGALLYGGPEIEVKFDDRVLAHLQVVIGAKLRRGESFFFTWRDDVSVGDGRSSVWLAPGIPLYFRYSGSKPPAINPEWIERLALSANGAQGLRLMDEPLGPNSAGASGKSQDNSVKPA
ncbi:hypothetical protein [Humibacter albus]|uniref:DUF7882 family protein n=1 Tax=Humibacter albus TaxID=427754 RepID=UPI0003B47513|nr:hypothetical protein [Humibacter albus]